MLLNAGKKNRHSYTGEQYHQTRCTARTNAKELCTILTRATRPLLFHACFVQKGYLPAGGEHTSFSRSTHVSLHWIDRKAPWFRKTVQDYGRDQGHRWRADEQGRRDNCLPAASSASLTRLQHIYSHHPLLPIVVGLDVPRYFVLPTNIACQQAEVPRLGTSEHWSGLRRRHMDGWMHLTTAITLPFLLQEEGTTGQAQAQVKSADWMLWVGRRYC